MDAYRRLYCNRKYRTGSNQFKMNTRKGRNIPDSNASAIERRQMDLLEF